MAETRLPQEFPRELALLRLEDVLQDLPAHAREEFRQCFEQRRAEPLDPRGVLLRGPGGLRPLMALMRLVVLRFRDINMERFETHGGEGRHLSAYIRGENLSAPLPERAGALFIERVDLVNPALAGDLASYTVPLLATWEGPETGPVWDVLQTKCRQIRL